MERKYNMSALIYSVLYNFSFYDVTFVLRSGYDRKSLEREIFKFDEYKCEIGRIVNKFENHQYILYYFKIKLNTDKLYLKYLKMYIY